MAVTVLSQKLRLEQLSRYKGSILDLTSSIPRDQERSRSKFKKECLFLAAFSAEELDEVQRLLDEGININTANADGMTALHQACLDQRLDLVEFLVKHSADVNICDNDGWTPLHAACSRDSVDIAKYLISKGSRLDALSFDGELPIDVAEDDEMHEFILKAMVKKGIDEESARKQEMERMMDDALFWLNSATYSNSIVDPKTGASPLHVAAARGYIEVMRVLLQAGSNVNAQDLDGWTPIHAAAHWGQKEACLLLADHFCDFSICNFSGLTAQDVADTELGHLIEELKKKQVKPSDIQNVKRRTFTGRRRSSVSRLSFDQRQSMIQKSRGEERATMEMMLAKRNSRNNSLEGCMNVFDVEEEKDEQMEEEEDEIQAPDSQEAEQDNSNRQDLLGKKTAELEAADKIQGNGEPENGPDNEEEEVDDSTGKGAVVEDDASQKTGATQTDAMEEEVEDEDEDDDEVMERDEKESLPAIVIQQNRINDSKTADANKESDRKNNDRASLVLPDIKPAEMSPTFVTSASSAAAAAAASSSLLSSATTAALRALAKSHRWSMDDPKKDEEKENPRRSRCVQLRKEKIEKRRSTQAVIKGDLDRAESSLQASDHRIEEELSESPALSDASTKEEGIKKNDLLHNTNLHLVDDLSKAKYLSALTNSKEDVAQLAMYRKSDPQDSTIQFDEDEFNVRLANLAKARRKGRLSARPVRQEMVEEVSPEKEKQSKSSPNETKQADGSSAQTEVVFRRSRQDYDTVNDYKKMYEKERSFNELLSLQNLRFQQEIVDIKLQLESAVKESKSNSKMATETGFSLQEKRALEKRIAELEEEAQNAAALKDVNKRLKDENASLIRVISKLSK